MGEIENTNDENDLLYLYSAVIQTVFNDSIEENEIEQLDVREIMNTCNLIVYVIDEAVNGKLRKLCNMLNATEEVEYQGSIFDEYDRENGYVEEDTGEAVWKSYGDVLDNILQICITSMKCSYKECLESDLSDLLDYVVFQVEYDRKTQAKE